MNKIASNKGRQIKRLSGLIGLEKEFFRFKKPNEKLLGVKNNAIYSKNTKAVKNPANLKARIAFIREKAKAMDAGKKGEIGRGINSGRKAKNELKILNNRKLSGELMADRINYKVNSNPAATLRKKNLLLL